MITREESKVRNELIDAIDKLFRSPTLEDFDCWYGQHHVERMADAALAVLMATKEAQQYMQKEELEPL